MVCQNSGDANAVGVAVSEGSLECPKQASRGCRARHGCADKPEFAKDALPMLAADAAPSRQVGEDGVELLFAVGRKLEGLAEGVDDPAKKNLARLPQAVSFQKFLQGKCFETFVRTDAWSGEDLHNGCSQLLSP